MAVGESVLRVGYVMKPSRQKDFVSRGAFPEETKENGLLFIPIALDAPLVPQLEKVDVVLHKATDEIIGINGHTHPDLAGGITFSKGMHDLLSYVQDHPECIVIDPIENIYPLLDRYVIQQTLVGLEILNAGSSCKLRAPKFLKVDDFADPGLGVKLSDAQVPLPAIVKPQIACGLSHAHNMAVVFRSEDFAGLPVPLPAIVQEYVDHNCVIYKFYVLGDAIFHAVRKSMPSVGFLKISSMKNSDAPILFDSLRSLPSEPEETYLKNAEMYKHLLDVGLIEKAARLLREKLGLTIFGFDVVIQAGSADHVIVDVNYLPSFKEVPNDVAIPAFWRAIRSAYEAQKLKQNKFSS